MIVSNNRAVVGCAAFWVCLPLHGTCKRGRGGGLPATQNIESYVRWRGDLELSVSPFNLIDNLVLCKLAYYDLASLPEVAGEEGLTVRECAERLGDDAATKGLQPTGTFLATCAASERFGCLRIRSYVDVDGIEHDTQFCAMEFVLDERRSFIAFRGTDNTLVGWREDFEISYRPAVAQQRALAYMREVLREGRSYLVGGHSKGANLALFATAHLSEALLGRISRIFLNDGPGLCKEVLPVVFSDSFLRKAIRILPAYSVFGRLFEQTEIPKVIVSTTSVGLMAHELMNWEVEDGKLSFVAEHHAASDRVATVFDTWMGNVTTGEREEFVGELFGALGVGGSHYVTDLSAKGLEDVEDLVSALMQTKPGAKATLVRLPLGAVLGTSLTKAREVGLLRWVLGDALAHNVELVIMGLTFLLARDDALVGMVSLLLLGIVVLLVVETVLRARGRREVLKQERWRVNVCVVALVLFVTTMLKDDALFVYGSTGLGVMLTAMSVFYANQVRARQGGRLMMVWHVVAAFLLAACAVFVFVAPAEAMDTLALGIGIIFVLAGTLGAVTLLWKRMHVRRPQEPGSPPFS